MPLLPSSLVSSSLTVALMSEPNASDNSTKVNPLLRAHQGRQKLFPALNPAGGGEGSRRRATTAGGGGYDGGDSSSANCAEARFGDTLRWRYSLSAVGKLAGIGVFGPGIVSRVDFWTALDYLRSFTSGSAFHEPLVVAIVLVWIRFMLIT